jgi:hypothetical protein
MVNRTQTKPARPTDNFTFSYSRRHRRSGKLSFNPFRFWFSVRSLKPVRNPPHTKLGEPTDPRQIRKRFGFGFGQDLWIAKRKTLRILQVIESEGPSFHCLIIRSSKVRVLVGQLFYTLQRVMIWTGRLSIFVVRCSSIKPRKHFYRLSSTLLKMSKRCTG